MSTLVKAELKRSTNEPEIIEEIEFIFPLDDFLEQLKPKEPTTLTTFSTDKFNFATPYNENYYKNKVPGLPEIYYDILSKVSK